MCSKSLVQTIGSRIMLLCVLIHNQMTNSVIKSNCRWFWHCSKSIGKTLPGQYVPEHSWQMITNLVNCNRVLYCSTSIGSALESKIGLLGAIRCSNAQKQFPKIANRSSWSQFEHYIWSLCVYPIISGHYVLTTLMINLSKLTLLN